MNMQIALEIISGFYIAYFIAINLFYLFLNYSSMFYSAKKIQFNDFYDLPHFFEGFDLGISILVPAYNEAKTIVNSINSILNLEYPVYEVIVINDGSTDETLSLLIEKFEFFPFLAANPQILPTKTIQTTYVSKKYSNLKLIHKENGGKSDSLNAGLSMAQHTLFCSIDADSILSRESLKKTIQPFWEDPKTIAVGGMICVADGCQIENSFIKKVDLPKQFLPLIQVVEYWRAFIFGRAGWTPFNAVPLISGAFSLFKKQFVIDVGGYSTQTVGEDMELVMRIHRHMRKHRIPYQIVFIPSSICWTDSPKTWKALGRQRIRWQRGLLESLWMNKDLLFDWRGGILSWFTMPCIILFDAIEPLIQVLGHLSVLIGFFLGYFSFSTYLGFVAIIFSVGVFLSFNALFIEEFSIHSYDRFSQFLKLFLAGILENFGFRQLNTLWRFIGFFGWVSGTRIKWGKLDLN